MSKLDLSDPALKQLVNEIKDEKNPTRWCVFGFERANSTKIKIVEKGTGDLEELKEELSDGQVQFGYIRYSINNLTKCVFISWCGDGVQGQAKGYYSNYSRDMEFFLKGSFHLQINARNEDDLVEKDITKKLLIAKGANFDAGKKVQGAQASFITSVKEGQKAVTQAPSKEIKRTDAGMVDKEASTKYWEEQRKKEAEDASKNEPKRTGPVIDKNASAKYWEEQKKKEAAEAKSDKPSREEYNVSAEREKFWQEQNQQEEEQKAQQKPQARPAPSSGGSRSIAAKFEQQQREAAEKQQAPPPRSTKPAAKPAPPPAPVQEEPQYEEPQYEEPAQEESQYEEPVQEEPQYEEPQYEEPAQEEEAQYEEPAQEESHYEEPVQEEELQYEEPAQEEEAQYEEPAQNYEEEETADFSASYMSRPPPPPTSSKPGQGKVRVKALYDFESDDSNDLSFKEGDIITVLDQSGDDGWWQGELDERVGLFPSNYVETIE